MDTKQRIINVARNINAAHQLLLDQSTKIQGIERTVLLCRVLWGETKAMRRANPILSLAITGYVNTVKLGLVQEANLALQTLGRELRR